MPRDAIDRAATSSRLSGNGLTTLRVQGDLDQDLAAKPLTPDRRQTPSLRPADQDEPDPVATRALARAVARLLWEWAQAGRPAIADEAGPRGADE